MEINVQVNWENPDGTASYETLPRDFSWTASGITVPASAAPKYFGTAGRVDPEQALLAAVSGCHMLSFLAVAVRKRLVVRRYADRATALLGLRPDGRQAITAITLAPELVWEAQPSHAVIEKIHQSAHRECFVANTLNCPVSVVGFAIKDASASRQD